MSTATFRQLGLRECGFGVLKGLGFEKTKTAILYATFRN
jgi:hypothetical protein